MKKTALWLIVALMIVALPALAQTADVDGVIRIAVPDDMTALEPTESDVQDGILIEAENLSMRLIVYAYGADDSFVQTLDELFESYLADQQEGFYANVAIKEIGGVRLIAYDIDEGTLGAITLHENGKTYEFILICEDDSGLDAARAVIDSIEKIEEAA
jgi:hypothetical protein